MPYQDCKGCKTPVRTPFEWCGDPCTPDVHKEIEVTDAIEQTVEAPPDVSEETLDFG